MMDKGKLEAALHNIAICKRDGLRPNQDELDTIYIAAEKWLKVLEHTERSGLLSEIKQSIGYCFDAIESTGSPQHKRELALIDTLQEMIY